MKKIRLYLCNRFIDEYRHILSEGKFEGVELVPFECKNYSNENKVHDETGSIHKDKEHIDYIMAHKQCDFYKQHMHFFDNYALMIDSCYNYLLDQTCINSLEDQGYLILNDGWISKTQDWLDRIKSEVSKFNGIKYIGQSITKINHEFSELYEQQVSVMKPANDLIKHRLELIQERVVNSMISERLDKISYTGDTTQRRLAETLMVNQLVRELFLINDKKKLIDKTRDILMMMLGAKKCYYVEDKSKKEAFTLNYIHKESSFYNPLTESIYIKSEYQKVFFGYWRVEELNYPSKALQYLNVSNMIGILFSIAMSRQDMIERLQVSQANLLHQEKMASIGQMAGGLAHEINNPLGYVNSNLDMLSKYFDELRIRFEAIIKEMSEDENHGTGFKPKTLMGMKNYLDFIKEDKEDLMDEITEGIHRIETIVNRFRSFSDVDDDGIFFFDINEMLLTIVDIFQSNYDQYAKIDLILGQLPLFEGYRGEINLIIYDIMNNSIEAIQANENLREGMISITTWAEEGAIFLLIEDNGIGIKKEDENKIFNPFYSTKPIGSGVGLGLTFAYDIITNRHKGTISISSIQNGFTSCKIMLPVTNKDIDGYS